MHREHDHHTHPAGATGGVGHNQPAPRTVQWQRPHVVGGEAQLDEAPTCEPDLDLVEAAFSEGFAIARDPTSFLRLAQVPFLLEDGQMVGRLAYERMAEEPDGLYGRIGTSNYQGQELKLSKHFA